MENTKEIIGDNEEYKQKGQNCEWTEYLCIGQWEVQVQKALLEGWLEQEMMLGNWYTESPVDVVAFTDKQLIVVEQ